jgi:hypothetical protein
VVDAPETAIITRVCIFYLPTRLPIVVPRVCVWGEEYLFAYDKTTISKTPNNKQPVVQQYYYYYYYCHQQTEPLKTATTQRFCQCAIGKAQA